ncbi:MAG: hypothetical protein R3Y64_06395 [Peptostreptococcaceae bacterium]
MKNFLDNIKEKDEVYAIFLVGSSKNKEIFENDVDLFVFTNDLGVQIRETKIFDNITFDISYFPKNCIDKLIEDREYFFLKEMKDPKIIFKKSDIKNIIKKCEYLFNKGPKKLSKEEINLEKENIYSKILDINICDKYSFFEINFLSNLILREILVLSFKIKGEWVPKDNKLFKGLNLEILTYIKNMNPSNSYQILIDLYNKIEVIL